MPRKSKKALIQAERIRKAVKKRLEMRQRGSVMEASGSSASADCTTTTTPQLQGPPPSTPTSASPSSAQKRKLLFSSEESSNEVEKEVKSVKSDIKFLCGAKEFQNFVVSHTSCRTCDTPLECNLDVKGADSVIEVLCATCEERFYTENPEIRHLQNGKQQYYETTMKLVYSAMFEGLSFTSVQRFCALYDMPLVSMCRNEDQVGEKEDNSGEAQPMERKA
ncbi:hypothetical protein Pmani_001627 [Petrolisthes manimaculis]|uniref:Uncharacterized protein n=1 Tax=Petrolisthes manimaculis TaxID=1843537 RepID=A0AAE1QK82_9EUCA|nr:hypothetical protein Pmani_001627 [Petrolisthes manimaculis]